MSKKIEPKSAEQPIDFGELRTQFSRYEKEIMNLLENYKASVETSKFAVEKEGEGFSIEVDIKASIQPRKKSRAR